MAFTYSCRQYITRQDNLNQKPSAFFFSVSFLILAVFIPATIPAVLLSRPVLNLYPGETTGLFPVFFINFFILLFICLPFGVLFPVCTRLINSGKARTSVTGIVYAYECLGAALGGVLTHFILIRFINQFLLFNIIGGVCLIFGLIPLLSNRLNKKPIKSITVFISIIIYTVLLYPYEKKLYNFGIQQQWLGHNIIKIKDTNYGKITITSINNQINIYQNSLLLSTSGNTLFAEERTHYSMLQHPCPENVLLIGGGFAGIINEVLKYPSVKLIDYAELDPELILLSEKFLSETETELFRNNKVNIHIRDGRLFIHETVIKYDVVILSLPEPYSSQLNRYYTKEFYNDIKSRLNEYGIVLTGLPSSENVIGDKLANFLGGVYFTLKSVFNNIVVLPGNTAFFLSSDSSSYISDSPDILWKRINNRNINPVYLDEYYLKYTLDKERSSYLKKRLDSIPVKRINSDFFPYIYIEKLIDWSTSLKGKETSVLQRFLLMDPETFWALLIIFLILSIIFSAVYRKNKKIVPGILIFAVISVGFSSISFEITSILVFQSIYGHLYNFIILLIAAFMSGLAAGGFTGNYFILKKAMLYTMYLFIQTALVFVILLFPIILFLSSKSGSLSGTPLLKNLLIPGFLFISGFLSGFHFVLTAGLLKKNRTNDFSGVLYSADLLGASAGALAAAIVIIPALGIIQANIFFCGILIISLSQLIICVKRTI